MGQEVALILPYLASLLYWCLNTFFFASVLKAEDPPYTNPWSWCVTRCCCANWSVKSVRPNCPNELFESYSCLIDFAQTSPAQTTLGFISKLETAVLFPIFSFKGCELWLGCLSQPLGTIRQLRVVSEQACALLQIFWKSERLILIHVKDLMCQEGGFSVSRCEICMWMEPSSAFVLRGMQRAPSPLNLEGTRVIQIKVIPINGWENGASWLSTTQGSNCKKDWSRAQDLLESPLEEIVWNGLQSAGDPASTQLFYKL